MTGPRILIAGADSRIVPAPGEAPATSPADWDPAVIERAINGLDLPDYEEAIPDVR